MRQVRKYVPARTWYLNAMQIKAREGATFPHVQVLSYHIPKVAGSSFSFSLRNAFGAQRMIGVYRKSTLAPKLSKGLPIWLPNRVRALHGMFDPHLKHRDMFPNAVIVIWVRDPLSRCVSLLNYWMQTDAGHDLEWQYFKRKYILSDLSFTELLRSLIHDQKLNELTRPYQSIVKTVPLDHFDFVGETAYFDRDISRFGVTLGLELPDAHLNDGKHSVQPDPDSIAELKLALEVEYQAIESLVTATHK